MPKLTLAALDARISALEAAQGNVTGTATGSDTEAAPVYVREPKPTCSCGKRFTGTNADANIAQHLGWAAARGHKRVANS